MEGTRSIAVALLDNASRILSFLLCLQVRARLQRFALRRFRRNLLDRIVRQHIGQLNVCVQTQPHFPEQLKPCSPTLVLRNEEPLLLVRKLNARSGDLNSGAGSDVLLVLSLLEDRLGRVRRSPELPLSQPLLVALARYALATLAVTTSWVLLRSERAESTPAFEALYRRMALKSKMVWVTDARMSKTLNGPTNFGNSTPGIGLLNRIPTASRLRVWLCCPTIASKLGSRAARA